MSSRLLLVALAVWLTLQIAARPASAVTDEEVGQTIDKIKKYLLSQQQRDGSFEAPNSGHYTGQSALVTLALLISGESAQRPEIARAIEFLASVKAGTPDPVSLTEDAKKRGAAAGGTPKTNATYALGVRCGVWAALPDEFQENLAEDASFLLEKSHNKKGGFHYTPSSGYDNSTTQYGVLGVWEAAKRGANVPPDFWNKVAEHFIKLQNEDGGWQYTGNTGASTPAMTTAGLASLFIVQQQLYGKRGSKTPPELAAAIDKGLDWLDKKYTPSGSMYYMYGVERVALASGHKYFNNQDWYQSGASVIVRSGGGGSVVDASFALLFLARGRYPVWVSKLAIPKYSWNNTPNDMQYLSRYLSDQREVELNWQVVRLSTKPEGWISAPLLYVTGDRALALDSEDAGKIKRFIDLGGMVLFSPSGAPGEFAKSVKELAKELYPNYPVRRLPPDHSLFTVLHQVPNAGGEEINGVSNGTRELMLLTTRDWGAEFQGMNYARGEGGSVGHTPIAKLAMNLWTIATDRGTLANRLARVHDLEAPKGGAAKTVTIGRARYAGNWNPEPATWELASADVQSRAGIALKAEDIELESIGSSSAPLVHLAGIDAPTLTEAQLGAIDAYVKKGGTLLVESVGGRSKFASQVEAQILKSLKLQSKPMHGSNDPILTGEGLGTGASPCLRVVYRRDAALTSVGTTPRLLAAYVGERPAVIYSVEDLSQGLLNLRQTGILGYSPDSARKLVTNLILSTQNRPKSSPVAVAATAPAASN